MTFGLYCACKSPGMLVNFRPKSSYYSGSIGLIWGSGKCIYANFSSGFDKDDSTTILGESQSSSGVNDFTDKIPPRKTAEEQF